MNLYDEFNWLTIVHDRYMGAYSGGEWTVFDMPPSVLYEDFNCKFEDDDTTCRDFWRRKDLPPIGRADTVEKAIEDLRRRYQEDDRYVLTENGWKLKEVVEFLKEGSNFTKKWLNILNENYKK